MTERIIFVDENDVPIGIGTREEAWAKGIYVRIVRAIISDENGRILSQLRSKEKKSYPGRWTDSASGHVDQGNSYDTAIKRELSEELGIDTNLSFVGKFASKDIIDGKTILEFNAIYEGNIHSSTTLELQESEVSDIKWYKLTELKRLMIDDPNSFTLGFRELIQRYY